MEDEKTVESLRSGHEKVIRIPVESRSCRAEKSETRWEGTKDGDGIEKLQALAIRGRFKAL